jgi:hypothetical protein
VTSEAHPALAAGLVRFDRAKADQAPAIDLAATAFPAQRAFILDPSALKYAICTRRAAKSYAIGLEHMASAMRHGGKHLLIGLTRESVRGAFWVDVLKEIDGKHHLGWRFNETRLEATAPSGGSIRLLGMDSNDSERRKALGQKYRAVAIDEAQDFRTDLEQLIFAVLKPAVADYRGSISLTGTPSNLIRSYYHDLTTGKHNGWSRHQWSTLDNPHMRDKWIAEIADLKAANPRVVDVPWFRQNYLGEWVVEDDKRCYRYSVGDNDYADLPKFKKGQWHYVLGCDLGYNDPTAWVVCAWHDHDRTLYMLEAFKAGQLDVTAVAARTRQLIARYAPLGGFDAMVIDNANKQAVEEMRRRHDLPWRPADKTGKSDFIELMNGEFIQGNIQLSAQCATLADEYSGLIWDERAVAREEHPGCPNHCADAALYAWRYCYAFLSQAPTPKPVLGTIEFEDALEEEDEERERQKLREEEEEASWI